MSTPSDVTVAMVILGLVQFAPVIMGIMWAYPSISSQPDVVFGVALVFLTAMVLVCVKTFQANNIQPSLLGVVFTFVTFTAYIDTFISLSLAFPWFEFGRFYLDHGERYFRCMYGFMCLFWDGTFHVVIQFAIAWFILTKRQWHFTGLVWAGSVLNSMSPLLFGSGTGPYAAEIQLSTALNGPYVLLPITVIALLLKQVDRPNNTHKSHVPAGSVSVFVDVILLAYNFVVPILHLIRVLCVLDSQTGIALYWKTNVEPILDVATIKDLSDKQDFAFVRIQVLQWAWWFCMWHWLCLYESVERIRTSRRTFVFARYGVDISAVILGGYLQSIVLYILTQVCDTKDNQFGITTRSHVQVPVLFWIVNMATLVSSALHFANYHVQDIEPSDHPKDE